MNAYSTDLRQRVLQAVDVGLPRQDAARLFGVSLSTINRLLRLRRETDHIAPKPRLGLARRIVPAQHPLLEAQLRQSPDATLQQHAALWQQEQGVRVSRATMARAVSRLGWTRKKSR